jgi:microsomal dipeptidase-like Zn-dependent dipeptidase
MRRGVLTFVVGLVMALACAASAGAAPAPEASASQSTQTRYSVANGCFVLRSRSQGRLVAKGAGGSYAATADAPGGAEAFRFKATTLGQYLLYGEAGDYMAHRPDLLPLLSQDRVGSEPKASPAADWTLEQVGARFRLQLPSKGKVLAASGTGGGLVLADPDSAGEAGEFSLESTDGCAVFPEPELNAFGRPATGKSSYGEVRGLIDAHMHMMAFEFLGGQAHCGRPWHPYGVEHALVDCPDHYPNGAGAALENVLFKQPARTHDPVGWPTFKDWPHHKSLTHEGSYYKWLERAWMGGLRVYVNLLVDNAVLCELYPLKRNSCNEMDSVRLQARRINELQDYIDAQSGGPGKGWFRVVRNPFEARRVINRGKLAVVLGIENSKLFDCGVFNDQPECNKAQIDRQLEEVHRLGVRDMELVNKFDNALSGVAGDSGETGLAVNNANKYETNQYWKMQHCEGANHVHDRSQATPPGVERDSLIGGFVQFLPPGQAPAYNSPPHCNQSGLTDLGEHLVRRMIQKKMMIDPDHMSVRARKQLLSIVESRRYSGIVSSHSWSTPDATPRIYKLGGIVTPYAGTSTSFVHAWRESKPLRDKRFFFGFGYGADMNGFGAQGGPREGGNVSYPFKSIDGRVTIDRQKSGSRVYDINKDGVAHYGLYPDWVEDLRKIAGKSIINDMARGPEAYLQMWERAEGIRGGSCRHHRARFTRRGLGKVRLGDSHARSLRRAGQPVSRGARIWRWCVRGKANRRKSVVAVLTRRANVGLVASTVRGHNAWKVGPGSSTRRLRGRARPLGRGLYVRKLGRNTRLVYGARGGKVRFAAVATRSVASSRKTLLRHLRLARLR